MRSRSMLAIAMLASLFVAVPADADPPRAAEARPSGSTATYRVTVGPQWAGTGVAVSRSGWVITGKNLTDRCPAAPEPCAIWVEDSARDVWRRAALVATDTRLGLALLRTEASLPDAARLSSRPARPGEPVHTFVYDGNDQRFGAGNVRDTTTAVLYGDPPASGRVVVSTLEHRDGFVGAGMFNIADDNLIGVLIGSVDSDSVTGTVAATGADVRVFFDRERTAYERQQRSAARK